MPIITGVDGSLSLMGLFLGELSNPPRVAALIIAQCLQLSSSKHSSDYNNNNNNDANVSSSSISRLSDRARQWLADRRRLLHWQQISGTIHFMTFIACRMACIHYSVRVVWPLASGWSIIFTSVALLIFSAAAVLEYLQAGLAPATPSSLSASTTPQSFNDVLV
jgi:hypothetical protein